MSRVSVPPERRSCITCAEYQTMLAKEIKKAEKRRARCVPVDLTEIERLKHEILICEHAHYASKKGATA